MLDSGAADQPISPSERPRPNPVRNAVERLDFVRSRLRRDGLAVVIATLIQLSIVLVTVFPVFPFLSCLFYATLGIVSIVLAGTVLLLVVHHEHLRKLAAAF